MITKYKTQGSYSTSITKVEVTKETNHSVWFMNGTKEVTERKSTEWQNYFDTFQQARDFLYEKHNTNVIRLKRTLADAETRLALVIDLKEI